MKRFTSTQLFVFCLLTAIVTAVAAVAFGETLYLPLKQALTERAEPEPTGDDRMVRKAHLQFQRILEARDSKLTAEEQVQLMKLFHDLDSWHLWYLGVPIKKNPIDLWMMQQILYEQKPDFIIETGTLHGGSAVYWAHILEGLGLHDSRVITIDIEDRIQADHHPLWKKYVTFYHSSSTDAETVAEIAELVKGKKVLVTLDSDHSMKHVLDELRMYAPLVTPGSYLVVEDTNMDAVPVTPEYGPGPMAAVEVFLEEGGSDLFEQDLLREALVLTFNPGGWLRRKDV